jgi:uncharacterized MAPEG superfamily protein
MTPELWSLFGMVCLGLVHISADSFSFKAQVGNAYTVGARDQDIERTALAGRMHRAARNFTESAVLFTAMILLVHVSGKASTLTAWAAWAWVVFRALYIPAYAITTPWVRTIAWQLSMIALVTLMVALFL